jgi:hypothetical protein
LGYPRCPACVCAHFHLSRDGCGASEVTPTTAPDDVNAVAADTSSATAATLASAPASDAAAASAPGTSGLAAKESAAALAPYISRERGVSVYEEAPGVRPGPPYISVLPNEAALGSAPDTSSGLAPVSSLGARPSSYYSLTLLPYLHPYFYTSEFSSSNVNHCCVRRRCWVIQNL